MAYNAYGAIAIAGETDGSLDNLLYSSLSDGDLGIVIQTSNETLYPYTWDSSDSTAEDNLKVVRAKTDGGAAGRWNLCGIQVMDLDVLNEFDIQGTTPVVGILDEDDMASDSATNLTTQQSQKAYVDSRSPSFACAFKARPAAQQSGSFDGATTEVVWGTEDFDIGTDFASNQFTAPNTGYYQFNVHVNLLNIDGATTTVTVRLNLSGSDNVDFVIDPSNLAADGGATVSFGVLTDMTAADTAKVEIIDSGEGAEQMTLETTSTFSGFQVA